MEIGRRANHNNRVWPHARAEKWGGEAWLEIAAKGAEPRAGKPERLTQSDSVLEIDCQRRKGSRWAGETHRIKTGSLKWEVVYNSTSDLPDGFAAFSLSSPAGLEFAYQPALSAEKIAGGHVRPDNVIGSYAVYWPKSGRFVRLDGTEVYNYESGKFAHIYRPKWLANNGQWIWGEQQIVGTELRITIPTAWIQSLGSAAFPLVLDPTFGYSSQGATYFAVEAGQLHGLQLSSNPAADGTVDSLHCMVQHLISPEAITMGLYPDDAGDPLGTSPLTNGIAPEVTGTGKGWEWVTYQANYVSKPSVTASTQYWFAFMLSGTGTVGYFAYDASGYASNMYRKIGLSYGLPDPFPADAQLFGQQDRYSAWATYTEASAEIPSGSASLSAVASTTATGHASHSGSGDLSAVATLSAVGYVVASGSADLSAAGSLAAVGYATASGSADLAAVAQTTAAGYATASGSVDLSAVGEITATGEAPSAIPSGSASLSAVATIAVVGYTLPAGSADLSAVGTVEATGYRTSSGAAELVGVGVLAADGSDGSSTAPVSDVLGRWGGTVGSSIVRGMA